MRAQRQLTKGQNTLSTVFERLSSGQRINRASDDAAGLAIADSLRADARVHAAAMRNISDGVSLLNIMDSALESQAGILTRLQELAEQAANGVYSSEQRSALNTEYQSLVREFGRIGDSTKFNDIDLLGGETTISLQAGTGTDNNSQININTQNFGSMSGTLTGGGDYGGSSRVDLGDFTLLVGFYNTLETEEFFDRVGQNYKEITVVDSSGVERSVFALQVLAGWNPGGDPGDNPGQIAYLYEGDDGIIYQAGITDLTASPITTTALSFAQFGGTSASITFDMSELELRPAATYGTADESAIDFTGVETEARALHAMGVVAKRAEEVSAMRGEIGANMSRLEIAHRVAQNTRENYLAAESRIRDADVAQEAAKLTQAQILQQVGAAILAQANQQPQITLQLLQGVRIR